MLGLRTDQSVFPTQKNINTLIEFMINVERNTYRKNSKQFGTVMGKNNWFELILIVISH